MFSLFPCVNQESIRILVTTSGFLPCVTHLSARITVFTQFLIRAALIVFPAVTSQLTTLRNDSNRGSRCSCWPSAGGQHQAPAGLACGVQRVGNQTDATNPPLLLDGIEARSERCRACQHSQHGCNVQTPCLAAQARQFRSPTLGQAAECDRHVSADTPRAPNHAQDHRISAGSATTWLRRLADRTREF